MNKGNIGKIKFSGFTKYITGFKRGNNIFYFSRDYFILFYYQYLCTSCCAFYCVHVLTVAIHRKYV